MRYEILMVELKSMKVNLGLAVGLPKFRRLLEAYALPDKV